MNPQSIDYSKLGKLLNLTTSDNDGEALNAMRAANRIVKSAGAMWDVILCPATKTRQKQETKRQRPSGHYPSIDEMLEVCLERIKGQALEFIESLAFYYESHGRLSDKQSASLEKFFDNCR